MKFLKIIHPYQSGENRGQLQRPPRPHFREPGTKILVDSWPRILFSFMMAYQLQNLKVFQVEGIKLPTKVEYITYCR